MGSDPKTEAAVALLRSDIDGLRELAFRDEGGTPSFPLPGAPAAQRAMDYIVDIERQISALEAARLVGPADREGLAEKVRAIRKREVHSAPDVDGLDAWMASVLDEVLALIETHEPARLGQREDAPLDAAWREAEAALPDRARYTMGVGEYSSRHYYAAAYDMIRGENTSEDGPTPAAALQALAARLRESKP